MDKFSNYFQAFYTSLSQAARTNIKTAAHEALWTLITPEVKKLNLANLSKVIEAIFTDHPQVANSLRLTYQVLTWNQQQQELPTALRTSLPKDWRNNIPDRIYFKLQDVDLLEIDLECITLKVADLQSANLRGAELENADLSHVCFDEGTVLKSVNFANAKIDNIDWPVNLDLSSSKATTLSVLKGFIKDAKPEALVERYEKTKTGILFVHRNPDLEKWFSLFFNCASTPKSGQAFEQAALERINILQNEPERNPAEIEVLNKLKGAIERSSATVNQPRI